MYQAEQVRQYLEQAFTMQLAVVEDGRPWIATVYFVADDDLNLYWLSWPNRRHSQAIAAGSPVAVALQIKANRPVIGLQAEGKAERVSDAEIIKAIMPRYIEKYGEGKQFYSNFIASTNKHELYRFTTDQFVIFKDEE